MASTFICLPIRVSPTGIIDDSVIVLNKTWSSSKINDELDSIKEIYVRSTRFETISSGTSGTISLPGSREIVLDDFGGTTDAVVTTIEGGRPTNFFAEDASGDVIAATMDGSGNWTLTATPSSYPVALVYRVREFFSEYDDFDSAVMGGLDIQIISDRSVSLVYNEITGVAASTLTTITSHTSTGGDKLTRVLVSGTNIAEYQVTLNGSPIAKERTNFGDNLGENLEFDPGLKLTNGDIVLVRVEHDRSMLGDFNATIVLED